MLWSFSSLLREGEDPAESEQPEAPDPERLDRSLALPSFFTASLTGLFPSRTK